MPAVIADLEAEDGKFHDEPAPHLDFAPAAMHARLLNTGFAVVGIARMHILRWPATGQEYPVFLAVVRTPDATAPSKA
jgi:hypothetical protein